MKLFVVIFLISAAATAWAGYSQPDYGYSQPDYGYGYGVTHQKDLYTTYRPYYITSTAVKPVYVVKPVQTVKPVVTKKPAYVAKPYYDTTALQGYGNGYGYYGSSYRPIWSSSSLSGTHYPYYGYGYTGSYAYNPYYYGNYKHGIGYYPATGYEHIDW